jgi:hypothetical protein
MIFSAVVKAKRKRCRKERFLSVIENRRYQLLVVSFPTKGELSSSATLLGPI